MPLVDAHSHNGPDDDDLFAILATIRMTPPLPPTSMRMRRLRYDVTAVKAHTHTTSRGSVVDVSNHTHPGGDPLGSLSVKVSTRRKNTFMRFCTTINTPCVWGPVPSGSGTLALSNTGGAVRIAPRPKDDPYEGKYVVTKGQDLGDLMLTFTASGTMVAGAGIRIELPDPNPAFPSFYRDNSAPGPPGGGGVRITRGQVTFSTDPVNDDADGISTDALYLKTTSKLQAGDTFSVRIRDVVTNPHGDGAEPNQDLTETVVDYAFAASTASPSVPPNDDNPILGEHLVPVEKPPIVTITGQHGAGELILEARDPRDTLTQATTDEELGDIVLTYKATQPMGQKSQVEIMIHSAWPNHPYPPADSSDERAGGVFVELDSGSVATLVINGRMLTATLDDGMDVGDTAELHVQEG